jgi:hypothetical protein
MEAEPEAEPGTDDEEPWVFGAGKLDEPGVPPLDVDEELLPMVSGLVMLRPGYYTQDKVGR